MLNAFEIPCKRLYLRAFFLSTRTYVRNDLSSHFPVFLSLFFLLARLIINLLSHCLCACFYECSTPSNCHVALKRPQFINENIALYHEHLCRFEIKRRTNRWNDSGNGKWSKWTKEGMFLCGIFRIVLLLIKTVHETSMKLYFVRCRYIVVLFEIKFCTTAQIFCAPKQNFLG